MPARASVGVSYGAHEHEAFRAYPTAARRRIRPPSCTTGSRPMLDHASRPGRRSSSAPRPISPRAGRRWSSTCCSYRQPARAFALRFDGRVVAYLNRCVHVPTEMDWQPGEFLDSDREFIICSIHGADLRADDRAVRRRAVRARPPDARSTITERDGQVYWYPSRDIRPVGRRCRTCELPGPPGANP